MQAESFRRSEKIIFIFIMKLSFSNAYLSLFLTFVFLTMAGCSFPPDVQPDEAPSDEVSALDQESSWVWFSSSDVPFSFEYPFGWHVAVDSDRNHHVSLHPEPLRFGAFEGDGGVIQLIPSPVLSKGGNIPLGEKHTDIFSKMLDEARRDALTDAREETFLSRGGQLVYRFSGNREAYGQQGSGLATEPSLVYLVEYETSNGFEQMRTFLFPQELLTPEKWKEYADVLDRVMRSFGG